MDIQQRIISKTLEESAFVTLVERGIRESFFPSPDHAKAFRWMQEYWQKYGDCPTAKAFKQNFPTYALVKTEEPLPFLIDTLREQKKMALIDETTLGVVEQRNAGEGPDVLLKYIATQTNEIHTEVSELRDADLIEEWDQLMELYEDLKDTPDGMRGIPLGFPKIDASTSGLQAGQLTTIIGVPKVGKSTLLLRTAINAHISGAPVLFIGFEMSNEEQMMRYASMRLRLSHERLMKGQLSEKEERKLKLGLEQLQEDYPQPFILSQDIMSATTLSGILAKVQRYRPRILFVDGVYMMDDESGEDKGSPRHLTNVTRGFKRMAQQLEIPIVITTQVLPWKMQGARGTKRKLSADDIGYSSSFAQDSDLIIGIEHLPEREDFKKVSVLLSRNTRTESITIRWDWDFGEFIETEPPEEEEHEPYE